MNGEFKVKFDGLYTLKGDDGYTPIKGVDYWTESDKTEIVEEVTEILTDEQKMLSVLIEADMLPAVYNADGKILTDSSGNVVLRY